MQGDKALNFTKPYELRLGVTRSGERGFSHCERDADERRCVA